jgi:hypothetical protein
MMIDGVNADDQILQVQLAETYRSFQLLNGQTYVVASTNGQFYCDYPNSNPPTFYAGSGTSTGQQMNMPFYDRPGQPMALVQDGAIAESCSVADAFYIFILYRSSTMPIDQYDPNNLWAPILCVTQWGWTATATVNLTDWELQNSGYTPIQQFPPFPPVWSGAISDFLLEGQINVAKEVLREKRSSAGAQDSDNS